MYQLSSAANGQTSAASLAHDCLYSAHWLADKAEASCVATAAPVVNDCQLHSNFPGRSGERVLAGRHCSSIMQLLCTHPQHGRNAGKPLQVQGERADLQPVRHGVFLLSHLRGHGQAPAQGTSHQTLPADLCWCPPFCRRMALALIRSYLLLCACVCHLQRGALNACAVRLLTAVLRGVRVYSLRHAIFLRANLAGLLLVLHLLHAKPFKALEFTLLKTASYHLSRFSTCSS